MCTQGGYQACGGNINRSDVLKPLLHALLVVTATAHVSTLPCASLLPQLQRFQHLCTALVQLHPQQLLLRAVLVAVSTVWRAVEDSAVGALGGVAASQTLAAALGETAVTVGEKLLGSGWMREDPCVLFLVHAS